MSTLFEDFSIADSKRYHITHCRITYLRGSITSFPTVNTSIYILLFYLDILDTLYNGLEALDYLTSRLCPGCPRQHLLAKENPRRISDTGFIHYA